MEPAGKNLKGNPKSRELSVGKKMLLNIILYSLPVVLFILLEIALRVFGFGEDLRLFKQSHSNKGYFEINQKVAKRFFTKLEISKPPKGLFLIHKPDSCYRIFVMGESAAMGFPYEIGNSFSRILNGRLQDVFPHKHIEIINTAMTAVNSYTLLDFTDEILRQKPDAIIIYTGHNEYYGALGVGSVENGGNIRWLKIIAFKAYSFSCISIVQNFVTAISKSIASNNNYMPQRDINGEDCKR